MSRLLGISRPLKRRAVAPPAVASTLGATASIAETAIRLDEVQFEEAFGEPNELIGTPPVPPKGQMSLQGAASEWEPRVLVVDDDQISLRAAAGLLRTLGLTVDLARGGQEALQLTDRWPYVAVFMDCEMPEVDGYTAARKLRGRAATHVPVIAVTSRSGSVSLASGMDHHLSKPLELDLLRSDCRRLGILARDGAPPSVAGRQLCIDTPLLDPYVFVQTVVSDSNRRAQAAANFVATATVRLPELWRAMNAGDAQALSGVALALSAQAAGVGAGRVCALCDRLAEAAARGAASGHIERQLRQALADTAGAIVGYLNVDVLVDESATERADQSDAEPPAATDGSGPQGPVRVAFADDDRIARITTRAMLSGAPWIELVGDAAGVEEAIELGAVEQPDVFVLDWNMPGGGGADAVRRILIQSPDTLIIALSSSDSLDTLAQVTDAGATCLVAKGGSGEELTQVIGRALERRSRSTRAAVRDTPPAGRRSRLGSEGTSTPPRNGTSASGSSLDPARVAQLHAEFAGTGLLAELAELFGSETPKHLSDLRSAIRAKDAQGVSRLAHQLKGVCLTLGAYRMGDLCGELEIAVIGGSLDGTTALADQIEFAFEAALASLLREVP